MKRDFSLRLTPAQTYYLRKLITTHADCRQDGWADLKRTLDANYAALARSEITYGAIPPKDLKAFTAIQAEHDT